ncbi:hypothetical protein PF008_g26412 [Phytophthora fragariae]|nr:hypothetical protein PF008_g26412 [Phytophthora fragariae]
MFKREYCRSKVSDAESYYTMTQDKDEKALASLHRLNLAAERAGVDFRKNSRGAPAARQTICQESPG